MIHCLNTTHWILAAKGCSLSEFRSKPLFLIPPRNSCTCNRNYIRFRRQRRTLCSFPGNAVLINNVEGSCSTAKVTDSEASFPDVQTLRRFPREELSAKTVVVRFDSSILLHAELRKHTPSISSALSTIQYVHEAGSKVILVSSWSLENDSKVLSVEKVAEQLSSLLQLEVMPTKCLSLSMQPQIEFLNSGGILLWENLSSTKADLANNSSFSRSLSSGIDIFINDCFSLAHKMLASTVGVTRYCGISIAGFHFEQCLLQLKNLVDCRKKPCVAIIGGANLVKKAEALRFLASRFSGLAFVGMMAFQMMHALGMPVPLNMINHGALAEAKELIQYADSRSIAILLPSDFLCRNKCFPKHMQVFPARSISDGWEPVDLGPRSLDEISSVLSSCEKIIWIGPTEFRPLNRKTAVASTLLLMLDKLCQRSCEITVIGTMACETVMGSSNSSSTYEMIESASVVWEFLKRRNLPGIMALDRAYPSQVEWNGIYCDSTQPLVVDIGSGNGLFLMDMASRRKDLNFLGLEINKKLVSRCLDSASQPGPTNVYFIATDATSTFRSIVSSFPGPLVLVSIQCPNPDFNQPDHRWRMVQRSLIEAIADLLMTGGKVFLQSDVKTVAVRMREQFLNEGKGKLHLMQNHYDARVGPDGWLKENPFGVQSDWECHVLARGAPMYRLMLLKE